SVGGRAAPPLDRRAQDLVMPYGLLERAPHRFHIEWSHKPQDNGHVIGRARSEIVEEPQPLLSERETKIGAAIDGGDRGRFGSLGALDLPGQLSHGRRFKDGAERYLDLASVANPRYDLGGQQRVSAQLEEVVVHADLVQS